MGKSLVFDVETINSTLNDLSKELIELETVRSNNVVSDLGEGWSSENAALVNTELAAFDESIKSIKASIDSIRGEVSQYSKNVVAVDSSISLKTNRG